MHRFLSAAIVAAAVYAAPVSAAVVSYTDATAFQAATTNHQTYGFTGELEYEFLPNGYSRGPATFTAGDLTMYVDNSYGDSIAYLEALGNMDVAFDGLQALSFQIGTWSSTATVAVIVNGMEIFSVDTAGHPSTTFVGLTSDEAITSVGFRAVRTGGQGGEFPPPLFADEEFPGEPGPGSFLPLFDIVSFQTAQLNTDDATDVPEPAMLGLFGLGAIGLGLSRRRRA